MRSVPPAKAVAVLGTASDVGKSVLAAGLCRLLVRAGVRVAPFKAQNMSLNSCVTPDGGEIGRAQALQAAACGLAPHVDMNPILLKPESDGASQVVVRGRVFGRRDARAYFEERDRLWPVVRESYRRLASEYDMLVIEGAGSAAEVNLRRYDVVNWPVVDLADARVLLVADIERGGVFAQVVGTLDLLEPSQRARVAGVIINKFRGETALFKDGVQFLEARTAIPVCGVVPYLPGLRLDEEDSVAMAHRRQQAFTDHMVNVAVLLLPRMSNFTDFGLLEEEPDVALRYVSTPQELSRADVIIIPGSKSTAGDLAYLRDSGLDGALAACRKTGVELVGICGGYQMLGTEIADPLGVESGGICKGLGFLDVRTDLQRDKRVTRVQGRSVASGLGIEANIAGYEIHAGLTARGAAAPCFALTEDRYGAPGWGGSAPSWLDGAASEDGLVWGTYVHGLFDMPSYRRAWLNRVRVRKGMAALSASISESVTARSHRELDRWADHLARHLDLPSLNVTHRL
jgi:adenosylcobyric acid synthase